MYLDGNSLGPLAVGVAERLRRTITDEWRSGLVRSWNDAGWVDLAERAGGKLAALLGARPEEIVVTDSTSVNLFKVLAAALSMRPDRTALVTVEGNFPTDRYIADGVSELSGGAIEVREVPRSALRDALTDDVAAVFLTHVDYRTGERLPARALTALAHQVGALAVWDLAHSAGAVNVHLHAWKADLAVGCTYKYLNGGPGAPGFVFVATEHAEAAANPIAGWWGHADPFAFADRYEAAPGARGFQVGTPPILSLAAVDEALWVWEDVPPDALDAKAASLTDLFIALIDDRCDGLGLSLLTPRESGRRGAHVTLRHPHAYAVMQALIDLDVIGDVRRPDLLRFGFAPLYVSHVDVCVAVERLQHVLTTEAWRSPAYADEATVI